MNQLSSTRALLLQHIEEISTRYYECEILLEEVADAIITLMSERADEEQVTPAVEAFCAGISELAMIHGSLPSRFFRVLVRLLEHPVFRSHTGGRAVFIQAAAHWHLFSEQQKSALLSLAAAVIQHGEEFKICFSATFFLVYHQESAACLEQVESLLSTAMQPGRKALPYALLVLSQEAEKRSVLRMRALRLLRSLQQDEDAETAGEARVLCGLERRQRKRPAGCETDTQPDSRNQEEKGGA